MTQWLICILKARLFLARKTPLTENFPSKERYFTLGIMRNSLPMNKNPRYMALCLILLLVILTVVSYSALRIFDRLDELESSVRRVASSVSDHEVRIEDLRSEVDDHNNKIDELESEISDVKWSKQ